MTQEPPLGDPPRPRRYSESLLYWQPPAESRAGRRAFFWIGALVVLVSVEAAAAVAALAVSRRLRAGPVTGTASFLLLVGPPFAARAYVAAQRNVRGERWRTGALVAGMVTSAAAVTLLAFGVAFALVY